MTMFFYFFFFFFFLQISNMYEWMYECIWITLRIRKRYIFIRIFSLTHKASYKFQSWVPHFVDIDKFLTVWPSIWRWTEVDKKIK